MVKRFRDFKDKSGSQKNYSRKRPCQSTLLFGVLVVAHSNPTNWGKTISSHAWCAGRSSHTRRYAMCWFMLIVQIYARSFKANDIRPIVQQFNMRRGEIEEQEAEERRQKLEREAAERERREWEGEDEEEGETTYSDSMLNSLSAPRRWRRTSWLERIHRRGQERPPGRRRPFHHNWTHEGIQNDRRSGRKVGESW